jgi:hypothetical protein
VWPVLPEVACATWIMATEDRGGVQRGIFMIVIVD